MMDRHKKNQPEGQSLVMLGVLAVALLIFLALIIDGGNAFAMRRLAQNASDAGALAGARDLCATGSQGTAATTARTWAEQNNLARLGNVQNQSASVSVGGGLVNVTTTILYDTFFARIIGFDQMTAVGYAQAGCYNPTAGQGVLPLAWECRGSGPGGTYGADCDIQFMNPPITDPNDDTCNLNEDTVYLFLSPKDANDDEKMACGHWSEGDRDEAIVIDCGTKGNGDPLIELVTPNHPTHGWVWIDLNGGRSRVSELNGWIAGSDVNVPDVEVHTWYGRVPVQNRSLYQSINTFQRGDSVVIPEFDEKCKSADPLQYCLDHDTGDTEPSPAHPGDGVEFLRNSDDEDVYYHVASFTIFEVNCANPRGNNNCRARRWINTNNETDLNGNSIDWSLYRSFEGCFKNGFHPGLIGSPSAGPASGGWKVYLTK